MGLLLSIYVLFRAVHKLLDFEEKKAITTDYKAIKGCLCNTCEVVVKSIHRAQRTSQNDKLLTLSNTNNLLGSYLCVCVCACVSVQLLQQVEHEVRVECDPLILTM